MPRPISCLPRARRVAQDVSLPARALARARCLERGAPLPVPRVIWVVVNIVVWIDPLLFAHRAFDDVAQSLLCVVVDDVVELVRCAVQRHDQVVEAVVACPESE